MASLGFGSTPNSRAGYDESATRRQWDTPAGRIQAQKLSGTYGGPGITSLSTPNARPGGYGQQPRSLSTPNARPGYDESAARAQWNTPEGRAQAAKLSGTYGGPGITSLSTPNARPGGYPRVGENPSQRPTMSYGNDTRTRGNDVRGYNPPGLNPQTYNTQPYSQAGGYTLPVQRPTVTYYGQPQPPGVYQDQITDYAPNNPQQQMARQMGQIGQQMGQQGWGGYNPPGSQIGAQNAYEQQMREQMMRQQQQQMGGGGAGPQYQQFVNRFQQMGVRQQPNYLRY